MPNEFNYFDPDDDFDAYQPNPIWKFVALGLLAVMVLFSVLAIVALIAG